MPTIDTARAVLSCLAWYEDRAELLAFARILVGDEEEAFAFDVHDLLYYLEKPWKWTEEHDAWVARGRP